MSVSRSQRNLSLISLSIILLAIIATGLLIFFRQQVVDNFRAWQFAPSSQVVKIRDSLQLTSLGGLYFDSSHTAIEKADGFNQNCPQSEPNNPVVGCYSSQMIYIYDVKNSKLDGIEETTAAHELLHAAYERMSDDERSDIDAELQKVYKTLKTKELEARMNYYQKNEPGEENNELHSILGTEFRQLGTTLENHYAKYFTDRSSVLSFYQKYQAVFTRITGRLDSLAVSINKRTLRLNKNITVYNNDQSVLNDDINQFKKRRFTSQTELDAVYNSLTSRQTVLDGRLRTLKSELAAIERLRKEYNTLRQEYEELSQSINSSLEPASTIKG